ncbi:MAG: nitrate reductase cytochrome c-type subunit [Halioglobus sp.]|jgi:cytochrome c-type protein NapB|nr:nitrate reductase cytochrome c-type subunit [Halieaceae bacterium]MBT5005923.1 nitrate reductase cytochrome c-type subunit [Halieaceae bacterium]MBT7718157.1 nitrate reductase cytochrome c-type subunit [Halieaceae bacterium]MDG1387330.1 nitrate reductase cytochrome c-type subunit [Halioglobus sp.]MDG2326994.1 nitrate reductase cytochrome c-type subunit [Halioglobus sp.]
MKSRMTITVLLGLALTAGALAQNVATTRDAALDVEPNPPKISRVENDDVKRKRAYPMQPPTVPHKIDNYQIDTNANKCMSCHSRRRTEESQAPMVSVTHYMDREGNFLADISARRYFCNQCHVVQIDVDPLLDNEFEDIDDLLRAARK